eukprot:1194992-Prorocentrum_minimum.AAC.2
MQPRQRRLQQRGRGRQRQAGDVQRAEGGWNCGDGGGTRGDWSLVPEGDPEPQARGATKPPPSGRAGRGGGRGRPNGAGAERAETTPSEEPGSQGREEPARLNKKRMIGGARQSGRRWWDFRVLLVAGRAQGESSVRIIKVGYWTQGEKRGRVSGVLRVRPRRFWHRRTRKMK